MIGVNKRKIPNVTVVNPPSMSTRAYHLMTALAEFALYHEQMVELFSSATAIMQYLNPEIFLEVFGEEPELSRSRNRQLCIEAIERERKGGGKHGE